MSKARHNRAVIDLVGLGGTSLWRASRYRFEKSQGEGRIGTGFGSYSIRVAPDAVWERFTPFSSYRYPSKVRELDSPHLEFLRLRNIWEEQPHFVKPFVEIFAYKFGLLGLFYERYSAPILPGHKQLILPEAVITERGGLERLDTETDRFDALQSVLTPQPADRGRQLSPNVVAFPWELEFLAKRGTPSGSPDASGGELYPWRVSWQEAKEAYGALLVLDERAIRKASVLCTREPIDAWLLAMPDAEFWNLNTNYVSSYLNQELVGVSPFESIGEDGRVEQGWRCSSLLQALHLMHHLDRMHRLDDYGEAPIRRCSRRGCLNVYRMGSQKSLYCSDRCTSLVTTRRNRGQET